jgi:TolB-like protein/class 3 adenylate cyclase/Tfp pilus assembly protein PilF
MSSNYRQLAAIMFTDIVGYTALMGENEKKAFDFLHKNRQIQQPLIKQFNGKWIKELGDGVLASFNSATDAVLCAGAIQQACAQVLDLQLRIGIHQGEVVFENGDVFGDGVNIASRLQTLAPIGGILISEAVYTNIRNKPEIKAELLGEERLKNVALPVKVYLVKTEGEKETIVELTKISGPKVIDTNKKQVYAKRFLPLLLGLILLVAIGVYFFLKEQRKHEDAVTSEIIQTERSIAVLPFTNMSNDPQQDYFALGVVDEILNHLFKIGGLNVISRTSSTAYKDSNKSSKEIAQELGVGNLLEGSIQKSGDRIRIIVQLINGKTDKYLWTEIYDRDLKDVFATQSEIAQKVAAVLKVKIDTATNNRLIHIPTTNTSAYNLYLLSKEKYQKGDMKGWKEQLEAVTRLDSSFAPAYADLGLYWLSSDENVKQVLDSVPPLLKKAMQLDSNLSSAHSYMAYYHYWYKWDFRAAEREWKKFFQLNPSGFWWVDYVDFLVADGKFQEALQFALKEYNRDRRNVTNWVNLAFAHYYTNQSDKARAVLDSASLTFKEPIVYYAKARLFVHLGEFQQVIANLDKYFALLPDRREGARLQAWLAIAYFHTGRAAEAEKIIEHLKYQSRKSQAGSPAFHIALIYAQTGRRELAIQWLEKGLDNHEVEMHWLKADRLFDPLRSNKQFQAIVNKIKPA